MTLAPQLLVHLRQVGERVDTGVRGKDVDAAELVGHAGRHRLDRTAVGDVAPAIARPSPQLRRGLCRRAASSRSTTTTRAPSAGEDRRDATPDAARRAGDDGDLFGESLAWAPEYTRAPDDAALSRERREVRLQPRARVDRNRAGRRGVRGRVRRRLLGLLPFAGGLQPGVLCGGRDRTSGRSWARSRRGRAAGRRGRGDDPRRRDHDARRRHVRRVQPRRRPVRVVGRRDSADVYPDRGRFRALRRAHAPADAATDRLPRGTARGRRGQREPARPLRRESRLPRATRGCDDDPPRRARRAQGSTSATARR